MTFRYSLVSLEKDADAIQLLEDEVNRHVFATAHAVGGEELQRPWVEVVAHLKALGVKTLLLQRKVIDTDYFEEHQAFYAKQHRPISPKSTRIHAFKCVRPDREKGMTDERYILHFLDTVPKELYRGYINTRPLRHAPVGSTVLQALEGREPSVSDDFPVRIGGNEFVVHGTPFLQQDNAVGACAQASMWMALRTLRRRHGNAAYSPAELTIAATRYLMVDRPFPGRRGLTIPQILDTVRFTGHDPLHIDLRNPEQMGKSDLLALIAPYIESGFPVLMVLEPAQGEGHVVLGIGLRKNSQPDDAPPREHVDKDGDVKIYYRPSANWLGGLLIHNDAAGPYQDLLPKADAQEGDFNIEDAISVVVPLPDGIYTTAAEAEHLAIRAMWRGCLIARHLSGVPPALPEVKLTLRMVLCTRHAFRRWVEADPHLDSKLKDLYRTFELPPYVWVVEIHDASKFDPTDPESLSRCGEVVLDASADRYHADSHIFTSLLSTLWPSDAHGMRAGVSLREPESNHLDCAHIDTGQLGRKIEFPWIE